MIAIYSDTNELVIVNGVLWWSVRIIASVSIDKYAMPILSSQQTNIIRIKCSVEEISLQYQLLIN